LFLVYTLYQSKARKEYGTYQNLSVQPFLQSNHHTENSNILLLAISYLYFVASIGQLSTTEYFNAGGK